MFDALEWTEEEKEVYRKTVIFREFRVRDLFEFKTPNGKLYARNIKNIESKRISNTYPCVVRQIQNNGAVIGSSIVMFCNQSLVYL